MKINPYRAAVGTLIIVSVVIILILVGMMVWSAIVDGWWRGALQWIGAILALLVFGYVSSSWENWEYEWDVKNGIRCKHGAVINNGIYCLHCLNHPTTEMCEHGKEINEEEVNCLECLGVPSDNPDDELRDCHD